LTSGFLLVAVAGDDGEAGILGEAGISDGEIAENENGAARGFDAASVEAMGAEAGARIFAVGNFGRAHRRRKKFSLKTSGTKLEFA
jgi:hypothetical protein